MPGRDIPLIDGQYYHVFNRGVAGQPVFFTKREYDHFLASMQYYRFTEVPFRYSHYLRLEPNERSNILSNLSPFNVYIKIIAFCLMQNHFHILALQQTTGGISRFIGKLTNSYTRYVNTKFNRKGALFGGKFKAVRIEDNEQLLHTVRYIHLNPYTSYKVKTIEELAQYPFSSLKLYLTKENNSEIEKSMVMSQYKSFASFRTFTFDQADYQRKLRDIKHLTLE